MNSKSVGIKQKATNMKHIPNHLISMYVLVVGCRRKPSQHRAVHAQGKCHNPDARSTQRHSKHGCLSSKLVALKLELRNTEKPLHN